MLEEDEGFGDITSEAVVEEAKEVNAYIISKDEGILAGMNIVREILEEIFPYMNIYPDEEKTGKTRVQGQAGHEPAFRPQDRKNE